MMKKSILRKNEFFGQYGNILNISFCSQFSRQQNSHQSFIYITYSNPFEACVAILCANNFRINNQQLKVTFGLTRLCKYFIRDSPCQNKVCLFLHSIPPEEDITISRDNSINQHLKNLGEAQTLGFLHKLLCQSSWEFKQVMQGFESFLPNISVLKTKLKQIQEPTKDF